MQYYCSFTSILRRRNNYKDSASLRSWSYPVAEAVFLCCLSCLHFISAVVGKFDFTVPAQRNDRFDQWKGHMFFLGIAKRCGPSFGQANFLEASAKASKWTKRHAKPKTRGALFFRERKESRNGASFYEKANISSILAFCIDSHLSTTKWAFTVRSSNGKRWSVLQWVRPIWLLRTI